MNGLEKINTKNRNSEKKKKENMLLFLFGFFVLVPMVCLLLPTVIFLVVAMFPSLLSLIIHSKYSTKFKYKTLCIGGINFAGALPYLFKLWFRDNSVYGAMNLLFSELGIFAVYIAACIGWAFYRIIPRTILGVMEAHDAHQVVSLKAEQAKLVSKWGDAVKTSLDEPEIKS